MGKCIPHKEKNVLGGTRNGREQRGSIRCGGYFAEFAIQAKWGPEDASRRIFSSRDTGHSLRDRKQAWGNGELQADRRLNRVDPT